VLIQNSGLGNLVNPLTSLLVPYRIPVLLIVSMRGWPQAADDEAHHGIMGAATEPVLRACDVPYRVLDSQGSRFAELLDDLSAPLRQGLPAALLVPRGAIGQAAHAHESIRSFDYPTRSAAFRALTRHLDDAAVVTTTGYISRQLMATADRPGNLYLQGSMGHALAVGTGIALKRPEQPVVVVDGDGSLLIHLGATVTATAIAPKNLLHVVIDNAVYESTGGQPTTSERVDWTQFGSAAGYRSSRLCTTVDAIERALADARGNAGPHLVVIAVAPLRDGPPPRISTSLSMIEIATRVRNWYRSARSEGS
jgi:phosphonopyruvate decarboxylase